MRPLEQGRREGTDSLSPWREQGGGQIVNQANPDQASAEAVQLGLVKRKSAREKLSQVRFLSRLIIGLSRWTIPRTNPDKPAAEPELVFIRLHYGESLAQRVAHCRQRRGVCTP